MEVINIKKLFKNKLLVTIILTFIIASSIIIPNIIAGHGIYTLIADFDYQGIPFNILMNYSIKNGFTSWNWYNDLGSNFIGTFAFYNLMSPFNLIGYLFPSKFFPYLIGPIFILKYVVTAIFSYLYLERYVNNKNYLIVGALLYTFSGFQLTNILFYHFHDVVAFFPLLLYSLDKLVYDNKKGYFLGTVALCCLTNWFFFIGEVLFLIIYYFIKVLTKEYKYNFNSFIKIIIEGLLGVLITAPILLPTLVFTMGNPRINGSWTIIHALKYNFINYFEIVRSLISPPELMSNRAILTATNYHSVEFYLPVVGIVLAVSYFFKRRKTSTSILMLISLLMMFIPILNSSFYLFTTVYYARWFFMPILIFSLASIKCLEEKLPIKSGLITTIIIIIIITILSLIFKKVHSFDIFDLQYLMIVLIIMLLGIIITVISTKVNKKKQIIFLLVSIFIYVSLFGNYMVYKYKNNSFKPMPGYIDYLKYNKKLNKYLNNHRTNTSELCYPNIGYINKINDLRTFNSNVNPSSFEFYNSIGISRQATTLIPVENKELNSLLGVKYVLYCNDTNITPYDYQKKIGAYSIYKNNDAKEIGFPVNDYINQEEFNKLIYEKRIIILNNKVLLDEKQIKKYKNILNNDINITKNKFIFEKNGFSSQINTASDVFIVYQVPYDKGFAATVNGKKVLFEKVDNGFIGLKVPKGENKIVFKYKPVGLKFGIILSTISILLISIYFKFDKLKI